MDENESTHPVGLVPRFIREERRINEINAAIERYTAANLQIPLSWVTERNELLEGLAKRGKEDAL